MTASTNIPSLIIDQWTLSNNDTFRICRFFTKRRKFESFSHQIHYLEPFLVAFFNLFAANTRLTPG